MIKNNTKKALEIFNSIKEFNLPKIKEYFNNCEDFIINIENMASFKNKLDGFSYAHYEIKQDDNDNINCATIYIKFPDDEKEELQVLSAIAHEYTHILQRKNDRYYFGLKKHINKKESIKIIEHFASLSFLDLEKYFINFLINNADFKNRLNNHLNNKTHFNSFEIQNLLKNELPKIIDNNIQNTLDILYHNNYVDFKDTNYKNALIEYFYNLSEMEKEAKETSCRSFELLNDDSYYEIFNENISKNIYTIFSNFLIQRLTFENFKSKPCGEKN